MSRDDFDFFHGSWTVHNRRLSSRLTGSTDWDEFPAVCVVRPLSGGHGFVDEITFPTLGYSGSNFGLYESDDDRWAHYWASGTDGVLQPAIYGRKTGTHRLEFNAVESFNGVPVDVRALWTIVSESEFLWEQAFRPTDGDWETNWHMTFRR
ncbi:hypothetical protein [Catelliglobosispora koreensis]|uniref:hypothetical protein n=1 Tax=Catelliglobosispora koreensis TaxID=129052 RepID=UPI000361C74D|nr:hypothetical protein [Catelliglobosispora koreensis]